MSKEELIKEELQILLRLPDSLAEKIRNHPDRNKLTDSSLGIEINPEGDQLNNFSFTIDGTSYPALLYNLPTILETHKTLDSKIFRKSGELGQAIQVFLTNQERELFKSTLPKIDSIGDYNDEEGDFYSSSGYTYATRNIIQKRFEKTRESKLSKVPRGMLDMVAEEIKKWKKNEKIEQWIDTYEEIVDAEDWMFKNPPNFAGGANTEEKQGIVIEIRGSEPFSVGSQWRSTDQGKLLLQHPEMLTRKIDHEIDQFEESFRVVQLQRKMKKKQRLRELRGNTKKWLRYLALKRKQEEREKKKKKKKGKEENLKGEEEREGEGEGEGGGENIDMEELGDTDRVTRDRNQIGEEEGRQGEGEGGEEGDEDEDSWMKGLSEDEEEGEEEINEDNTGIEEGDEKEEEEMVVD